MNMQQFDRLCRAACTKWCRDMEYPDNEDTQRSFHSGAMFMVCGAKQDANWDKKLKEYEDGNAAAS